MPIDRTSAPPSPAEALRARYDAPSLPESVRCGIEAVDEEHAICEAQHERAAAAARAGRGAALRAALRSWRRLTAAHFQSEEALMREVGFPELAARRAAHARFLGDVDLALAELTGEAVPPRVATFVLEAGPRWIDGHYANDRAVRRHADASGRRPAHPSRVWRAGVPDLDAPPGIEEEVILIEDDDIVEVLGTGADDLLDVEVVLEPEPAAAFEPEPIEVAEPIAAAPAAASPVPEAPADEVVLELEPPVVPEPLPAVAPTAAAPAIAVPRGPSPGELAAARAALRESAGALAVALRHGEVARARELADAILAQVQALFDDEERLMREEDYAATAPHAVAHLLFLRDLDQLRSGLASGSAGGAARWAEGRTAAWLAAHHALADAALDGFLSDVALARA